MKNIFLSGKNGVEKFVIVDDENYKLLNVYKWFLGGGYAYTNILKNKKRNLAYMHRIILGLKKGEVCDHINGNKLDNRKENLRICSKSQNQWNRIKNKNNTSGFKGVYWSKKDKRWIAYLRFYGKVKHLGSFIDPVSASFSYKDGAKKYYQEFANTGFHSSSSCASD